MANSRKICIEQTADQAITLATELTKTIICEAVDQHQSCYLALSGGTTPQPMYQRLASSGMADEAPWSDVEIFFGDERHVSLDNAESNYHMAQRILLDNLPIEPGKVHPIRGDSPNLDLAVEEYEQTIRRIVPAGAGGIPRFDLILLGMGGDGHVASLFAGTDAQNERKKLVAANFVPMLGRMRLTFTFPLINAAKNVMFLICGNDKAEAVGALLNNDIEARNRIAGAKVCPTDGQLIFVLDAAGSKTGQDVIGHSCIWYNPAMSAWDEITAAIKALALEAGFAAVGIASAGATPGAERYHRWLELGYHGQMEYLRRNTPQRLSPDALVPAAKSVICLVVGYAGGKVAWASCPCVAGSSRSCQTPENHQKTMDETSMLRYSYGHGGQRQNFPNLIARYAQGRDYHKVLKKRCIGLMDRIRRIAPQFSGRAFVDCAPIMERSLAVSSGLGYIARNGCLVAAGMGSYVLLCEIVCNLPLTFDSPLGQSKITCDSCGCCPKACPTGALEDSGMIDARRCISYLTIEHPGPIAPQLWPIMGTHVFGCDACQDACWLNSALSAGEAQLAARENIASLKIADILNWMPQDWDKITRGSALRRASYEMFIRNAIIAAGNSGDPSLIGSLQALRTRHRDFGPMIDWAIGRLKDDDG